MYFGLLSFLFRVVCLDITGPKQNDLALDRSSSMNEYQFFKRNRIWTEKRMDLYYRDPFAYKVRDSLSWTVTDVLWVEV